MKELKNKKTSSASVNTESGTIDIVTEPSTLANAGPNTEEVEKKIAKIVTATIKMIDTLKQFTGYNFPTSISKIVKFYDELKPLMAKNEVDFDEIDQVLVIKNAALVSNELESMQRVIVESSMEAVYGMKFTVEKSIFSKLTAKLDVNPMCEEGIKITKLPVALSDIILKILQERSVRYGSI